MSGKSLIAKKSNGRPKPAAVVSNPVIPQQEYDEEEAYDDEESEQSDGPMGTFAQLCLIHTQKMGTALMCLLLLLVGAISDESIVPDSILKYGTFMGWLIYLAIWSVVKWLFGGWNSYSMKGMVWSVILSSIAGVLISVSIMKSGGGSVSVWGIIIQFVLSICAAGYAYNKVEDWISSAYAESVTADGIISSIFDNGLRNTFGGFMDDVEAMGFYSAGRAVAVYSNVIIFSGIIIGMFC